MILSSYDFPSMSDQQTIMELGAQSAEQCRSVVVAEGGEARVLDWYRHRGDRALRLRHPKPMSEIQAVEELEEAGEGHRVVEIMIYTDTPTLSELGIPSPEPDLRLNSHQNWYFRIPAQEGAHIVGQVQVLEVVKGDGEINFAAMKDTLEAHHVSPSGEMNVVTRPGWDAWVEHLIQGGFRRRRAE